MVQLLYYFPDWKDTGLALGTDVPTGKSLSSSEIAGMIMRIKAFGCTKCYRCGRWVLAFKRAWELLGGEEAACAWAWATQGCPELLSWWLMLKKAPTVPCSRHRGSAGAGVAGSVTGGPGKGGFTPA